MRKGEDPNLQDETLWRAQRRLNGQLPRIPRECLKFGKSRWDSYAKGTHPSAKFKMPPVGSYGAPVTYVAIVYHRA
jgi:hypothetical protein